MLFWVLLLFSLVTNFCCEGHVPCYYHQVNSYTYHEEFKPAKSCDQSCTVTPFVSPDNSIDAHMSMIRDATRTIVIAIPSFQSWSRMCNIHYSACDKDPPKCTGCHLDEIWQNEKFPVFKALIDAIRVKKLQVKILVNNYSVSTCKDNATLLDWLHVNGAEIRFYRSTSFLHAKFMMIDGGKKVLVSSVNFSETSFKYNRETGVIVSDCANCDALNLYGRVFDWDWEEAEEFVLSNSYEEGQLQIIKNKQIKNTWNSSAQSLESFQGTEIIQTYVAPDYAFKTFFDFLESIKQSLLVHIYEIEEKEICTKIVSLHRKGIYVSVIVSNKTEDPYSNKRKRECYNNITSAGINLVKNNTFRFSHQKYWIVDDTDVHLSTGNWNPSDFRPGYDDKPIPANKYPIYANRDMLIVMRGEGIVKYFKTLFVKDGGEIK